MREHLSLIMCSPIPHILRLPVRLSVPSCIPASWFTVMHTCSMVHRHAYLQNGSESQILFYLKCEHFLREMTRETYRLKHRSFGFIIGNSIDLQCKYHYVDMLYGQGLLLVPQTEAMTSHSQIFYAALDSFRGHSLYHVLYLSRFI